MERGYLDRRKQQIQRDIVDAERNGDSNASTSSSGEDGAHPYVEHLK
jgi:hypothetical protein